VKVPPVHLPEESHPEVGAAEEGEAEGGPAEHGQAEWNNSVPAQHSVSGRTFSSQTKRSDRPLKKKAALNLYVQGSRSTIRRC